MDISRCHLRLEMKQPGLQSVMSLRGALQSWTHRVCLKALFKFYDVVMLMVPDHEYTKALPRKIGHIEKFCNM